LLVRSPSVNTPDNFKISIGTDMHIGEVKQEIERQHPSSPRAHDMRVIWKGRILNDDYPVMKIYEHGNEQVEEAPEPQTVHFVLNTPISVPKQPTVSAAKQAETQRKAAPLAADSGKEGVSAGNTAIVPLGNQFQYVLVNGVPYLMELSPLGHTMPTMSPEALDSEDDEDDDTPIGDILARSTTMLSQYQRMQRLLTETHELMDRMDARQNGGGNNQGARVADQHHQHGVPLDMFRSINFSAIWNAAWLLLRMALLVAVFAHDASWERLILLGAMVLGFVILQSRGVREGFARLNNVNGEQEEGG
ncbi:hypothetical protein FBU59_006411, partial [Linderina macrospora]